MCIEYLCVCVCVLSIRVVVLPKRSGAKTSNVSLPPLSLEQRVVPVKTICTCSNDLAAACCTTCVVHYTLELRTTYCVGVCLCADYDMTSTAAQSASSADMILLWRLVVQDQEQHRMTRNEFIAFYKLMGMVEPFGGDGRAMRGRWEGDARAMRGRCEGDAGACEL